MVMNGKFCRKCSEPMIMLSKYQSMCESCKLETKTGAKAWKKKRNGKQIK